MRDYHSYFKSSHFYHIYNRAIGNEHLFKEKKNYQYFLDKWDKYILAHAKIWAYVLMPNHFHFLVQIEGEDSFPDNTEINSFLENQFKRLFSSYTLAFNKMYNRTGSLFQKRFKRVEVDSESYLQHLIHYIHHNPIHHNFASEYPEWEYSSYQSVLSSGSTKVYRKGVLNLFSGREKFRSYHDKMKNYDQISHLIPE